MPGSSPPRGTQGFATGKVERTRNPIGLASLVIAAIALVLTVVPLGGLVAGLPALVAIGLGFAGVLSRHRRRRMAAFGLGLGVVSLVIAAAVTVTTVSSVVASHVKAQRNRDASLPGAFTTDGAPAAAGVPSKRFPDLPLGAHRVVYTASGTGTLHLRYSTYSDAVTYRPRPLASQPGSRSDSTLAAQQTVRVTAAGQAVELLVTVTSDDSNGRIGCGISVDGRRVLTRASAHGGSAQAVTCAVRSGS
jgi:hypothetical protein